MHLGKRPSHQPASLHHGLLWDVHAIPSSPQRKSSFTAVITKISQPHQLPNCVMPPTFYYSTPLSQLWGSLGSLTLPQLTPPQLSWGTGKCDRSSMPLLVLKVHILDSFRPDITWNHRPSVVAISSRECGGTYCSLIMSERKACFSIAQIAKYVRGLDSWALGLCLRMWLGQGTYSSLEFSLIPQSFFPNPKKVFIFPLWIGEEMGGGNKEPSLINVFHILVLH